MAEIGEPIRVIEVQPLELPVPSPSETPEFAPAPEEVPVEA
ncbi:MAG TPA: hypothetical protein VGT98_15600 [Candidatus Elarobacter sp.]|nr:hypothetical protein [Candidatus Elarobacter sp.]